MFDVLIIGGGFWGFLRFNFVVVSAQTKILQRIKKIGLFTHQKSSNLQEALFNNAYGIMNF
jgi:hypothetical protein